MPRYFNTAGPCEADHHYMVPAVERLPEARPLIEQLGYFVLHLETITPQPSVRSLQA